MCPPPAGETPSVAQPALITWIMWRNLWWLAPYTFVGFLYAAISEPGAFALIYVPSKVMVQGNAAVTASNIVAHETPFRFGIASQLISQILSCG